jgi:hypothetical protein
MTAQEFQALLIEGGLTTEEVAKLTGNASTMAKVTQLRQATEYQAIEQRANALLAEKQQIEAAKATLEAELIGTDAKPGSRKYQQWYAENYATITGNANKLKELEDSSKALEASVKEYEAKYGKIGATTTPPALPSSIPGLTKEEVQAIAKEISTGAAKESVEEAYKNVYAPKVTGTLIGVGTAVEMNIMRNIARGKKTPIDWKKLDELAAKPEIAGDVVKAYEEWDAPNVLEDQKTAEAARLAADEKRIEDQVNERMKKRMLQSNFPAGAEGASSSTGAGTPSPLSRDGIGGDKKVYDRSKLLDAFQSVQ